MFGDIRGLPKEGKRRQEMLLRTTSSEEDSMLSMTH